MTKLLVRVALTSAAVLLIAGCTSKEAGTASPAGTSSVPPAVTGTSSASSGGATTSSLDPCSLLVASEIASFGAFGEPNKREEFGARSCGYLMKTQHASDPQLGIDVNIRDSQGIDTVNDTGKGITPGKVNGREAKVVPTGTSGCIFAMAVGSASRVDISITSAVDSAKACDTATQVADIVEPKLPKG